MLVSLLVFLTSLATGADVSTFANEFAKHAGVPVVVEWHGPRVHIPLSFKGESLSDKLKTAAAAAGYRMVLTERFVALQCEFVEPSHRRYSDLERWSRAQKKPASEDFAVSSNAVAAKMRDGATCSVRELVDLGVLGSAAQCFLDERIVLSDGDWDKRVVLDAIAALLGGSIEEAIEKPSLRILGREFRQRRVAQAKAIVANAPKSWEEVHYAAKIEVECLPMIDARTIESLFSSRELDCLVPALPGSALGGAVMAKYTYAVSVVPESQRASLEVLEGEPPAARVTGNGNVGGRVPLKKGDYLHF